MQNSLISCDGTTDFTGEDLECFYIRICSKGTIEDVFIHIGSPESSSSEDIFNYVMEMFKTNDIDIKKLVGFTADGASNMQGLKTGLAARLLVDTPHLVITHCVAHRLELAFKDAIKASSKSMYDRAMTLLLGLHYLYKKSPKMKKSLKRSFAALNQKQILPTRVGGTRWLPHVSKALYTFFKGYSAIRQQLENASHANPKAEGLVKLMQDGQLMVFLLLLKVIFIIKIMLILA
ncbi:hypothetical protein FSP39_000304 [Pinctada imbricata]|uniref:DUF4371 domain-containing protein n=1 Tax=Pinctada imbricata TaxID=66713 RepID=A0AA89BIH2_PINIB|nr:hypothetical protein FSP39_000304 [Pinctada imbricata]